MAKYQQMERLVHFWLLKISCEEPSFDFGKGIMPLTKKFTRNIMILIVTFLAPSLAMNCLQDTGAIRKPK